MFRHMRVITVVATAAACVVSACLVSAKEKKKVVLPDYVLAAQTVMVLIEPGAGIPVNDPGANKTAQDDVEKALMRWGRLRLTVDVVQADLLIVIRKGNKKVIQPTVGGEPTNDRPIIVQQTDSAIRIGASEGHPIGQQPGQPTEPGLGGEVGSTDDTFLVYQGQVDAPLERAPVWRFTAKNALNPPEVLAVAEFKKAVDEAVKQQQQAQQKKQQQLPQASKP
jgi:hypothetical protein